MDWPMLRALGEPERRELLRRTRRRRFARNEVLVHEGDPADTLHLLAKGRVSVRATTPFGELRRRHPSVDRFLIELLVEQVQRLHARLLEALFVPAETRVLRRLVDLADAYGSGSPASPPTVIPLNQEMLASLAGTSRATTNQVLRAAELAGVVTVGRSRVEIVDLDALVRRAR